MIQVKASSSTLPQPVAVIDDDPFVRSVVTAALNAAGLDEVWAYASGEEAVAGLDGIQPALVLMDYVLPGMSGPATWQVIRERMASSGRQAHLVFLTARADTGIVRDTPGACGLLAKPFNPLTLAARLCEILGASAAPAPQAASHNRLAGVAAQFRGALPDTARTMDEAWQAVRSGGWHKPSVQMLLEHAHKLAGTAGLFGFHAVGAAAEALEILLLRCLERDAPPGGDELRRLEAAVGALVAACRAA